MKKLLTLALAGLMGLATVGCKPEEEREPVRDPAPETEPNGVEPLPEPGVRDTEPDATRDPADTTTDPDTTRDTDPGTTETRRPEIREEGADDLPQSR